MFKCKPTCRQRYLLLPHSQCPEFVWLLIMMMIFVVVTVMDAEQRRTEPDAGRERIINIGFGKMPASNVLFIHMAAGWFIIMWRIIFLILRGVLFISLLIPGVILCCVYDRCVIRYPRLDRSGTYERPLPS